MMKKLPKIWYMIWFVSGMFLLISGCLFKSEIERKEWFHYALKYDKSRGQMIARAATENFLSDYNEMSKTRRKFLKAKQPTEPEIISVLNSPNRKFQRVGLAAMSLKPIESKAIVDLLFKFLKENDREFRLYAVFSLKNFKNIAETHKAELGEQLLEIINLEKDSEILSREISLLGDFSTPDAIPFLTKQLIREGDENRIFRYSAF